MSTATSTRAHRPVRATTRPQPRTAAGRGRTAWAPDAAPRIAGPADRPRHDGLVLTRRGRRLLRAVVLSLTTTLVAIVLVLAWLGAAASVAPGAAAGEGAPGVVSAALTSFEPSEVSDPVEVVVRPGDTLWQIARSNAPERDPRSVVAEIVRTNELGSTAVAAGAVLMVPSS